MSASDRRSDHRFDRRSGLREAAAPAVPRWERPAFEVICLACEISAYAPDEGEPLF